MKINWWCGRRVAEGWFNVDAAHHPAAPRAPDLLHALAFAPDGSVLNPTPLPDGRAEALQAIHALEHVYEWEAPHLLGEWARLLRPGGHLWLEMPDLIKCAQNLVDARRERKPGQLTLWGIYGDPEPKDPLNMHKTGWWFDRLAPVVSAAGFTDIIERETQFHGIGRGVRDFRLEARKS